MKYRQYQYIFCKLGIVIILGLLLGACDSTSPHEEFIEEGSIVYPGAPDSILVRPGKNRIQLSFPLPSDPSVSKARVYWRNGRDSVEVPIDRSEGKETVDIMLTDMEEGTYTFDIYTFDDEGNASVNVTAIGEVYGDNYVNSLLQRLVKRVRFIDNMLEVEWADADETVIATEISYTGTSDASRLIYIPAEDNMSVVADYDFNANDAFQYRTMYLPDSMAIDTFYTAKMPQGKGPPVEYPKADWTADASSYRTGNEPENIIDGDPSTIWVNEVGGDDSFPFILTVDMGEEKEPVDGIFLQQRQGTNPRLKDFELQVSPDSIEWRSSDNFELADDEDIQYFDFPSTEGFRYFRIFCYTTHRDKSNCSLAEAGVYKR